MAERAKYINNVHLASVQTLQLQYVLLMLITDLKRKVKS